MHSAFLFECKHNRIIILFVTVEDRNYAGVGVLSILGSAPAFFLLPGK